MSGGRCPRQASAGKKEEKRNTVTQTTNNKLIMQLELGRTVTCRVHSSRVSLFLARLRPTTSKIPRPESSRPRKSSLSKPRLHRPSAARVLPRGAKRNYAPTAPRGTYVKYACTSSTVNTCSPTKFSYRCGFLERPVRLIVPPSRRFVREARFDSERPSASLHSPG